MKKFLFMMLLPVMMSAQVNEKAAIDQVLTSWHQAATEADFERYFGLMTKDAVFIGTDATENWTLQQFKDFAKPYFDNGRAWDFKAVERNIHLGPDGYAWFDELLTTWMKFCRGSGVMKKENGQWKIVHYVLSMTVPNDVVNEVVKVKQPIEDKLLQQIQKK